MNKLLCWVCCIGLFCLAFTIYGKALDGWIKHYGESALDTKITHDGKDSVRITLDGKKTKSGCVSKTLVLNQKNAEKFPVSFWSKANITGISITRGEKVKYCYFVKVLFQDGTKRWVNEIKIKPVSHGWTSHTMYCKLEKPVKEAYLYCIASGVTGTMWFDDAKIQEIKSSVSKRRKCTLLFKDINHNGNKEIVLENSFIKMIISPSEGGACHKFYYKQGKVDFAGQEPDFALLADRIGEIKYNELQDKKYAYKVIENTPDKITVELKLSKFPYYPYLSLSKKITICRDRSTVKVDYKFDNEYAAMSPVVITPWFRGGFGVYGRKHYYYLPMHKGIVKYNSNNLKSNSKYFDNINYGWLALNDSEGNGLACEFDYKYLKKAYVWGDGSRDNATLEWIFNPVKIQNGKSFKTTYYLTPFTGIKRVDGVENSIISQIDRPGGGKLKIRLASGRDYIGQLVVKRLGNKKNFFKKFVDLVAGTTSSWNVNGLFKKNLLVKCDFICNKQNLASTIKPFNQKYTFKPRKRKLKPQVTIDNKINLTTKVVTSHIKWAKPYSQGKTKALILVGLEEAREIVELAQRMDLDYRAVRISGSWKFVIHGMAKNFGQYTKGNLNENLKKALAEKYDTIIISDDILRFADTENRQKIAQITAAGTGLVLISPSILPERIQKVMPLAGLKTYTQFRSNWQIKNKHFLSAGFPFEIMPITTNRKYKLAGKEIITAGGKPLLAISEGKNRIVSFAYCSRPKKAYLNTGAALTPLFEFEDEVADFAYQEYYFSLLAKAVLWTAHKTPKILIKALRIKNGVFELQLDNKKKSQIIIAKINIKNILSGKQQIIKQSYSLPNGEKALSLKLPKDSLLPGLNIVDAILYNKQKEVINWGSCTFIEKKSVNISALKILTENLTPSCNVQVETNLSVSNTKSNELQIQLINSWGNVVAQVRHSAKNGKNITTLKMPKDPTLIMQIKSDVLCGNILNDSKTEQVDVKLPQKPWNDYLSLTAASLEYCIKSYLKIPFFEALRKQGINSVRIYGERGKLLKSIVKLNFNLFEAYLGPGRQCLPNKFKYASKMYNQTKDKKYLSRKPCLNDPKYLDLVSKQTIKNALPTRKYNFFAYRSGDEGSLTFYEAKFDFCFSKDTLKEFRKWLKDIYGSLGALNKEWETGYNEWQEVMPLTTKEIQAKAKIDQNYSQWADHRIFMEKTFADFYGMIRDGLRAEGITAAFGTSGITGPHSYAGFDWWRLSKSMNYVQPYWGKIMHELMRSFNMIVTPWNGYGQTGQAMIRPVWYNALMHKGYGHAYWGTMCSVNPDYTPSQSISDYAKATKDLRDGIGKMLIFSNKVSPDVLIHYSQSSLHAATIADRRAEFNKSLNAWMYLLEDMNLSYDFIAYEEIEQGKLLKSKVKFLILPESIAISKLEAENIRKFVAAGGTVIADNNAARMDNHCKLLKHGLLDNVFGVIRNNSKKTNTVAELVFGKYKWKQIISEAIKATTAKSLSRGKALFVNKYKQGKAVLLNMIMRGYSSLQRREKRKYHELMRQLISVTPRVSITNKNGGATDCRAFIYEPKGSKDALFLGLLNSGSASKAEETINIKFLKPYHIYDVRGKRYLGFKEKIAIPIKLAEAKFFALLPSKFNKLTLESNNKSIESGERVNYTVEANYVNNKFNGDDVINIELLNAKGEKCYWNSKNEMLHNGHYSGSFQIPFNGSSGVWTLNVKHVISGITQTLNIKVK